MGFGSIARRFWAMRSDRRRRLVGLSIAALLMFGFVLPNSPASGQQVPPGILPPGHTYTDAQAQWLVNGVRHAEEVLPQYANRAALPGMGYVNIGVLSAGREHWVNVNMFNDEHFLNPAYPESLVLRNGQLEAAMLFAHSNVTMETIPDIVRFIPGWHAHPELCSDDQGRIIGFNPGTGCTVGRPATVPMVHVWIVDPGCGHRFGGLGVGGLQCNYDDHSGDDHSMPPPTTAPPTPTTAPPTPTTAPPAPTTTMPPMDHGDHGDHGEH
jgi:hypothetical protein